LKRSFVKSVLNYRFTFILVPHGASQSRQVSLPVFSLFLCLVLWSTVTAWVPIYPPSCRLLAAQASNEVLKLKVKFLLGQLDKSREFLDQVKNRGKPIEDHDQLSKRIVVDQK